MKAIIGKLSSAISSGNMHAFILSRKKREDCRAWYLGDHPPKTTANAEYEFQGRWESYRLFVIESYKRVTS